MLGPDGVCATEEGVGRAGDPQVEIEVEVDVKDAGVGLCGIRWLRTSKFGGYPLHVFVTVTCPGDLAHFGAANQWE